MSHPAAGAGGAGGRQSLGEVSQVAKLALLGVGTLATGMLGLASLTVGYQLKKKTAPDPSKVTPLTYIDDLTHLVPPWQHTDGAGAAASASAAAAGPSFRVASPGGMDVHGFGDAGSPGGRIAAEVELWAAMNAEEEAELRYVYDPDAFAHVHTSTAAFPLTPAELHRVCAFLPYESVCVLTRVSRGLRDFSRTLLSRPNFAYQLARSRAGFSEQYRGRIWMRTSGAGALAVSMGQRASATARDNFYEFQRRMSIGYRELLIAHNRMGRNSPQPSSGSASPVPLSAEAQLVDLEDLTEHARSSLDTILKDVPRTLVPSNAASASLISNPGVSEEEEAKGSDAVASSSASARGAHGLNTARDDLIKALSNVLSVYSLHDTSLGYCQGMNYVAMFLLQKLPEQDAYWLLYKVMQDNAWGLRQFYMSDLKGLLFCKYAFARFFRAYMPELYQHFKAQDVHSDIFTEWFMTFFTFSSFPRRYPLLDRLWDLLLAGRGLKYLFRVALSILYLAQSTLLEYEFENILFYIKHLPDEGILNPDVLLPLANDRFPVSHRALRQIQQEYEMEMAAEEQKARKEEEARTQARREEAAAKQRMEELRQREGS